MSESIVFLFHRSTLYLCNDVNITRHHLPSSDRFKILLSTINIQCQCIRLQKRKAHKIALCRNPFLDISSFLATARCHPAADMRNLSPGYQRCGLPRTYSLVYKIAVRSSRGYDRPSLWRYQPILVVMPPAECHRPINVTRTYATDWAVGLRFWAAHESTAASGLHCIANPRSIRPEIERTSD